MHFRKIKNTKNKGIFCLSFLALLAIFFGLETISYGDNLGSSLTQCANDNDNDGVINACQWITGALTGVNSEYAESDGVPQRWLFEHLSTGSTEDHTAVFQYTFTKNDVYAYDFLVDVNHTMPMALINPCGNLPPFADPDDCINAFGGAMNELIPSDPFDAVSSREHPPARHILFGCIEEGTLGPFACTNVSVDTPVHIPNTNCFQNCGNSDVQITVNFRTPAAGQHLIGMWLSAQLASAQDPDGSSGPAIGWGTGFGASSTPGSSFHFKLVSLDGKNVGGEDDQLNSNSISPHKSDLEVDKTCPATVVKGNNVSYTITVTNNGPETATNVFIHDTLPTGVTFVSATPSQGTCNAPVGDILHCDIGFIQPGDTATITVVVTVPAGFVGSSITDTVTVGGAVKDPVSENNTASCTTNLQPATTPVDLSVAKTCPTPAIAGNPANLIYSIDVKNNSGTGATGVTLIDSLPGGVTFVSSNPAGPTCTESSGVVTCNLGSLGAGVTTTVTITVHVDPSVRGTITNVVTVSGDQTDDNTDNNTDSCDTTVNGNIDLSVAKSCPASAVEGTQITYDITVSNAGPSTALDPHIEDMLPSGVTFVSATTDAGSGCTFNLVDTVHCVLGPIDAGGSTQAHITVLINSGQAGNTLTNEAHIHVHSNEDANSANDSDTCATDVTALPQNCVDLSVTKTDSPDPVVAGSNLTYTITATNTNNTNTAATNVTLVDTLPAGVTFVSASAGCAFDGVDKVTCNLGIISANSSKQVTITITVNELITGTITNSVSVGGSEPDCDTGNNSASADTVVVAPVEAPPPVGIPTLTEWGMIIFMIFAGLGSVYYLRRQRRV